MSLSLITVLYTVAHLRYLYCVLVQLYHLYSLMLYLYLLARRWRSNCFALSAIVLYLVIPTLSARHVSCACRGCVRGCGPVRAPCMAHGPCPVCVVCGAAAGGSWLVRGHVRCAYGTGSQAYFQLWSRFLGLRRILCYSCMLQ